jgi:hypothetical protein
MKTWFNHALPLALTVILLFFYIVPGLLLIAFMWGKFKCPNCGAVGKNIPPRPIPIVPMDERKCPYCAETIKSEAVVCRFCGRQVDAQKGTPLRA